MNGLWKRIISSFGARNGRCVHPKNLGKEGIVMTAEDVLLPTNAVVVVVGHPPATSAQDSWDSREALCEIFFHKF